MIHPKAIELIKLYEGFDSHPYKCPADVWTYGYGATRNIEGERVTSSTEPISKLEAEELLIKMVGRFASRVDGMVDVEINELQRGALTSFAYNLGSGALKSSTLLRHINAGEWDDIPYQFSRWVFAGGQRLPGLVSRRRSEAMMWLA